MKKSKILMPILGVGAVAATVAPMVTMTACNKKEIVFEVQQKEIQTLSGGSQANLIVTWKSFKTGYILEVFPTDSEWSDNTITVGSAQIKDSSPTGINLLIKTALASKAKISGKLTIKYKIYKQGESPDKIKMKKTTIPGITIEGIE